MLIKPGYGENILRIGQVFRGFYLSWKSYSRGHRGLWEQYKVNEIK